MLWNVGSCLNCVAKRVLLVLVLCWFFWSKAFILHRSVVKCKTFLRPELSTIDLFSTSLISASQKWVEAEKTRQTACLVVFFVGNLNRSVHDSNGPSWNGPSWTQDQKNVSTRKTFHCHVVLRKEWHRVCDGSWSFLKHLGLIFCSIEMSATRQAFRMQIILSRGAWLFSTNRKSESCRSFTHSRWWQKNPLAPIDIENTPPCS